MCQIRGGMVDKMITTVSWNGLSGGWGRKERGGNTIERIVVMGRKCPHPSSRPFQLSGVG